MPFLMRDDTAGVDILYIDNAGQAGLMGSSNAGQALTFAGLGVVNTDANVSDGLVAPGTPSPLAGTIVIPVGGTATVNYSVPQIPTIAAGIDPDAVTVTFASFTNTTGADITVPYKVW